MKISNYLLFALIFLIALKHFFIKTSVVQSYSMENSLKPGNYLVIICNPFKSFLKNKDIINRGDIIVFKSSEDSTDEGSLFVKRCIGMPGERLNCRDGLFYINSTRYTEPLSVINRYIIYLNWDSVNRVYSHDKFKPHAKGIEITCDSKEVIRVKESLKTKLGIEPQIVIENPSNMGIPFNNANWSINNFGPLIIPNQDLSKKVAVNDHFFFVGDNRPFSIDSRQTGFISDDQIIGVVWKVFD